MEKFTIVCSSGTFRSSDAYEVFLRVHKLWGVWIIDEASCNKSLILKDSNQTIVINEVLVPGMIQWNLEGGNVDTSNGRTDFESFRLSLSGVVMKCEHESVSIILSALSGGYWKYKRSLIVCIHRYLCFPFASIQQRGMFGLSCEQTSRKVPDVRKRSSNCSRGPPIAKSWR